MMTTREGSAYGKGRTRRPVRDRDRRRVHADTERQGHSGHGGEARSLPHDAAGVSQVLDNPGEERRTHVHPRILRPLKRGASRVFLETEGTEVFTTESAELAE